MMSDLAFSSAIGQADLVLRKEISPVELVTLYLERIARLDPQMNSYVTVVPELALERARTAEKVVMAGDDLPPFHGVPVSIKDLHDTAGIRTTYGCATYADYVPMQDTTAVRRLREAGFIVLGKTNAPELGTVPVTESALHGVCRNPWDTNRTPGGSSGGAAAALAAGLCPISHGSDGGGSIRIPASCCGVFGLKPARGRVSSGPDRGDSLAGLATDGPIARTVEDAAAMLDVMAGYELGDPYWAPPPARPFRDEVGAPVDVLRVAFTTTPPTYAPVDAECVAAVEETAKLLESLGHKVEEAEPDWFDPELISHFFNVWQLVPVYNEISDYTQLEDLNRSFGELSEQTSVATFVRSMIALQRLSRRIVSMWKDFDLLLTPTLALEPVPVGWITQDPDPGMQFARCGFFTPFTPQANLTGQPAVSLPLYWTEGGLPIGVQLIGGPADEALLLRVSAQLEEARPWRSRRPGLVQSETA
jgi:amidase